jgi:site-specific recombinase XerD
MSEAETNTEAAAPASGVSEELCLGDAIHFFLSAKRAGGRSQRTIDDYRKKLKLFQRWVASRYAGEEAVDAPNLYIGADEVESYVVYLREERGMADSSRKNHLAVLRSFFQTLSRRLEVPDPTRTLDEVRFHSSAPKRSYLTKREAEILLSSMDKQVTDVSNTDERSIGVSEARRRALAGPWPPATTRRSRP